MKELNKSTTQKGCKYIAVIVHDQSFHCDDLLCAAFGMLINSDINIIRTRNDEIINWGLKRDDVLVCDVGFGELDHHQKDARKREDGRKYAGCGLLYEKLVNEGLLPYNNKLLKIIKNVEHFDNGEVDKKEKQCLVVKYAYLCSVLFNRKDNNKQFKHIVYEFQRILDGILYGKLTSIWLFISIKTFFLSMINSIDYFRCKLKYLSVFCHSEDKEVLVLDEYIRHPNSISSTVCKFIIYPTDGQISLRALNVSKNSFETKAKIKEEYKDILSFRHQNGFFGVMRYNDPSQKNECIKKMIGIAKDSLKN